MPAFPREKRAVPVPSGEGGTQTAGAGSTQSQLLELLLDEAPALVRQRSLLPAFDWRKATPFQVERLLDRLARLNCNVPAWLASGLLIAGHRIPADALRNCSPELLALAALNAIEAAGLPEGLSQQMLDYARFGEMQANTVAPIVARLVALGELPLACKVALSQFHAAPEAVRHVREHLTCHIEALPEIRLRLAGTSTTHGLTSALKLAFAAAGHRAEVSEADFASAIPELLRKDQSAAALVLLLDRTLIDGLDLRLSADDHRKLSDGRIDALMGAIESWCQHASRPLLVNTLPATAMPTAGHVDRHHPAGEARLIGEVNRRLAEIAARESNLLIVDADVALARVPPAERSEAKLWFYGRQAYSDDALRALAHAFGRVWQAKDRGGAKVLALDFDNTLWGGVFGDDGLDELQCGDDFPGNAFKALQQECLRLKAQGMLLVGLSKNNPDALEVFSKHPGMALRPDDFVAAAVNWEPKPDNIKRLAAELGLGLDSFIFLDDSPHEREAMRRMCPSIGVPEMPADPAERPLWLRSLACTWPLRLTEEDTRRSEMYIADRMGRELRETVQDYDQYLSSLEQKLIILPVTPATLGRAAQLHQRTNQFNLTTRRLNEPEIMVFMSGEAGGLCLLGQVRDRFGDHGIVIASCVSIAGEAARIETLVMSCRVIGRQIESAFLDALCLELKSRGVRNIVGIYRPSARNGVARGLYPSTGFVAAGEVDGAELWEIDTEESAPFVHRPKPVTVEWETT